MDISKLVGSDGMGSHMNLGGLLIGSWICGITYGVLVLQVSRYLLSFKKDPIFLRSAVVLIFLNETAWSLMTYVAVYRRLINPPTGFMSSFIPPTVLVVTSINNATTMVLCNLFLIWRYQRLTKRLFLCIFLVLLAIAAWSCLMWGTACNLTLTNIDVNRLDLTKLGSIMDAVEYGAIAGKVGMSLELAIVTLIWGLFLGHLVNFLRRDMLDVRRVIKKLIMVSIESSTVTTALCITNLVYFSTNSTSSNTIVLAGITARVYFMSMMFNLNMRESGGRIMHNSSDSRPSIGRPSSSFQRSNDSNAKPGPYRHAVISVSQSTTVDVDDHTANYEKMDDRKRTQSQLTDFPLVSLPPRALAQPNSYPARSHSSDVV